MTKSKVAARGSRMPSIAGSSRRSSRIAALLRPASSPVPFHLASATKSEDNSGLVDVADRLVRSGRNLLGGAWVPARSGSEVVVHSPYTGTVIGSVPDSGADDVDDAVRAAAAAWPAWAETPLKERVRPLQRFAAIVSRKADELAQTVALESGKTRNEALGGIQRGLEVVEFAVSLPNLDHGGALEVSRGVTCEYRREPLGVVAGVTPFNFPAMVPMWMFPIALAVGNAFILKPSEKVPLSACLLGQWLLEAG